MADFDTTQLLKYLSDQYSVSDKPELRLDPAMETPPKLELKTQEDPMFYVRKPALAEGLKLPDEGSTIAPAATIQTDTQPSENGPNSTPPKDDLAPAVEPSPREKEKVQAQTLQEQLVQKQMTLLDQQEAQRKELYNNLKKSKGLEYTNEKGEIVPENRGLFGLRGFLRDRPDDQKKAFAEGLNSLDYYTSFDQKRTPPENKPSLGAEQVANEAKIFQDLNSGRINALTGASGLLKDAREEKHSAELHDPDSGSSVSSREMVQKFAPDLFAKIAAQTPGGKPTAAQLDPWVKLLVNANMGEKKIDAQKAAAERKDDVALGRLELARTKFLQDVASKNRAHYIIDQNTGTVWDSNGKVQPTSETLAYAKKHGLKVSMAQVPEALAPAAIAPSTATPAPTPAQGQGGGAPAVVTPPAEVKPAMPGEVRPAQYNKQTEKLAQKLGADLEEAGRGAGISVKNATEVKRRSGQLRALIGPLDPKTGLPMTPLTPEQMAEVAISVNSMLGGGTGNVAQYKDLIPKNFEMTAAKLKEYFASKPYGTDQAEWVKYYLDMADREKGAAQKYIEDITTSRIPINGSPLRKQDPKKFDQVLKGKGLNPDSFDADGLPIKGKDVHFYNDKDLDTKPKGWTDDWVIYKTTSGKRYWAPPGNAVPGKSSVEAR